MKCAVCTTQMFANEGTSYTIGALHGRLCDGCQASLSTVVGRWLAQRMQVAEQERERRSALEVELAPRKFMGVKMAKVG